MPRRLYYNYIMLYYDLEIAVDQQTKACDQTFNEVPDFEMKNCQI